MKQPKEMTDNQLLAVVNKSIGVDLTPKIKDRLIDCLKELEVRHYKIAFNGETLAILAPPKENGK